MNGTLQDRTERISDAMIKTDSEYSRESERQRERNRLRVSNSRKVRIFADIVEEMQDFEIITTSEGDRLLSYNEKYKSKINEPLKKPLHQKQSHEFKSVTICARDGCTKKAKRGMKYCSSICAPFALSHPEDEF